MATAIDLDPYEQDRLRVVAGRGLDGCAPSNKVLARVLEAGEPDTSRWRKGRRPSHWSRVAEDVVKLASNPKTSPEPYIAELMVEAERARMGRSTESLVREWWSLTRAEHQHEAAENSAHGCKRLDLKEAAEADVSEAVTQIRRAAISRELQARIEDGEPEADPYHPTWRDA